MEDILKKAKSYLSNTHTKAGDVNIKEMSLREKLTFFTDPFISFGGDLCIKLRSFDRHKKIKNIHVKMPWITVNLKNKDDIKVIVDFLNEIYEHRDVLLEVANERQRRWQEKDVG